MTDFIQNLVGSDFWATFLMSFVPMIELKGGIVFARGLEYNFFEALGIAYLGSTLALVPVYFLLRPILNLLKKIKWFNTFVIKVEHYFEERAHTTLKKQEQMQGKKKRSEVGLKQLSVFIFIAIPLPMTGIWMGTAIAVFLSLKFKETILPAVMGNLVAGTLIALLAEFCVAVWSIKALDYILYGMLGLAVVLLIFVVVKLLLKPHAKQVEEKEE